MSILSVDNISPIGSGTSVTVNSAATLVLTNANSTGVVTATSFVGSGANLTNLPAQATIANNANNRVITGGSGVNLNGESGVTYDGTNFTISSGVLKLTDESNGQQLRIGASGDFFIEHDGSNAVLKNTTGETRIQNDNNVLITASSGGTERFKVDSSGNATVSNGNLIIGTSGKGIDFSATANSGGTMENELLNDYEEGTWVPVYQNVNTPNYGHRSGRYTKIGRFVYLVCQISVDSGLDTSDGSTVNIGGFPFTGNNAHGSCLFTLGQYIDVMPDSTIDLFTNVRFNGDSVLLHEGRNNQDITYTQLNSSGNLQFACSYAL